MIIMHFWPAPNGYKPLILLEELGIDYRIEPVDISRGAQHAPEFLAISPNGRMPAIVDNAPTDGGTPITLFESGAILSYLADKHARFTPMATRGRFEVRQWLYWQVSGFGPTMSEAAHFLHEDATNARKRYSDEVKRLLGVLDNRLAGRDFICGTYSIADIASYPWVRIADDLGIDLGQWSDLARWTSRLRERRAVGRAYEIGELLQADLNFDQTAREARFGTGVRSAARG